MKKVLYVVISLILIMATTIGCGKEEKKESSSSLERVSTVNYNAGKKMLEYADSFISFDITEEEFVEKYDELTEKMINEKPRDALVSSSSYLLKSTIESYGKGWKEYEDVVDARDHLAEILEEPAYDSATRSSLKQSEPRTIKDNNSQNISNTASKDDSSAEKTDNSPTGEKKYEEIAKEDYSIIDGMDLILVLYKQQDTGKTELQATVEAQDFKSIKLANDTLYSYASADKAFDGFMLKATIDNDMVLSYTYHVDEDKITLVFGKETVGGELKAKAPSWSTVEDDDWDDILTKSNILINTADAYNDFADKHRND